MYKRQAFGLVNLAARVVHHSSPAAFATDPATYALVVAGLGGYLCYALALQRGSVTAATAAVVTGETVAPGLVGVALLGDGARAGLGWLAVLGFAVTVGGTFVLARFGEIEQSPPPRGRAERRPRGRSPFVRPWLRGAGSDPPAEESTGESTDEVERMTKDAAPLGPGVGRDTDTPHPWTAG